MFQLNVGCEICLDNFDNERFAVAIRCGHVFHEDCLQQWFRSNQACPKCRLSVPPNTMCRLFFNYTGIQSVAATTYSSQVSRIEKPVDLNCDDILEKINELQIAIYRADVNRKSFVQRLDEVENTLKQLQSDMETGHEILDKRQSQLFGEAQESTD